MQWSSLSLALLHFAAIAKGADVYPTNRGNVLSTTGDLHIVNKAISPDGFQRNAVLAGISSGQSTFPGPLIKGKKGDTFRINVINELKDPGQDLSTSIHWHGIHQRHTNWADGPTWVTQCPIVPNEAFKYQFSVPDQAGTFWYHSHHRAQYCDGLRGALVIYDPYDPQAHLYDVDDESTVITLADWYHISARTLVSQPGAKFSNSTLINGLGRAPENLKAPLAVINVEKGKRYRMRLVSLSCDPFYTFSIDSHSMTIIEADGEPTQPLKVNSLDIFAAQRYSFVLDANQQVGNYWIRARPNTINGNRTDFEGGINSAILRYKGAKNAEPTSNGPSNGVALRESQLQNNSPVPGKPVPGGADLVLNMTISFIAPGAFTINNVAFQSPTTPVLLQILSGAKTAQDLLPKGSIYELPRNKVIEIHFTIDDTTGAPHPMHLHGHTFDVIKSADSDNFNFKNPVRRDTVVVQPNALTAFRFVTDNAGPWFLHCHIEFHLVAGLAVVLAEATENVKTDVPVPADWNKLCPAWNSTPDSVRGDP